MKKAIIVLSISELLSATIGIAMIVEFFTIGGGNGAGFWYFNDVLLIVLPLASITSNIKATIIVTNKSTNAVKALVTAFRCFVLHASYAALLGGLGLLATVFIATAFGGSTILQLFLLVCTIGFASLIIHLFLWNSVIKHYRRTETAPPSAIENQLK